MKIKPKKQNRTLPIVLLFLAFIIFSVIIVYNFYSVKEIDAEIPNVNGKVEQNPQIIKAQLGNSFTLVNNQSAFIESGEIKLRFIGVKEDTRCPKNVFCVDKGWIRLDIEFYKNNKLIGEYEIADNYQNTPSSIEIEDYSIKILDVSPYPIGAEEINSEDYKATFLINKA